MSSRGAALLLSVFEGVPIEDAAVLLDADPALVKKARTIGLGELTRNLARMQGWVSTPARCPLARLLIASIAALVTAQGLTAPCYYLSSWLTLHPLSLCHRLAKRPLPDV